jgi:hypothetical protein
MGLQIVGFAGDGAGCGCCGGSTPSLACGSCGIPKTTLSCTVAWSGVAGATDGSATFPLPWGGVNTWGSGNCACSGSGSTCADITCDCPISFTYEFEPPLPFTACDCFTMVLECVDEQVIIQWMGCNDGGGPGQGPCASSSNTPDSCSDNLLTSLTCGEDFAAACSFPLSGGTVDVTITV